MNAYRRQGLFGLKAVGRSGCVALVLLAVVGGGCVAARTDVTPTKPPAAKRVSQPKAGSNEAAFDDLAVLTEAILLVQRYYVEEKPFRDVVYGAIEGMLTELDPNSSFLPPQPLASLEEETKGSFGGIGVSVGVRGGEVKVIAPVEDSPAFKAGIHAGDTITAVDGKKLEGLSVDEAVKAMRGEKGSPVKVTVERPNGDKVEVALVRDDIKMTPVKGIRAMGDGIGYLRITQFNELAVEDFSKALATLEKERITDLIIDLRDNPGGLLEAAVGIAEQVLARGKEIVTVRGRDGVEPQQRFDAGPCERRFTEVPIAVLVNGGSASASEIVAGALKAHHRAVLVGEKTYGKASVQNVIKLALRPDCAVRLTTGFYYTPDGKMIHGIGIEPDVQVPMTKSEWRQAQMRRLYDEMPGSSAGGMQNLMQGVKDEPLERAKELLKGARILKKG
jgi:carboxyl-terminal processing protease